MRSIAELISRLLDVPAKSLTGEEAAGHFGWLAGFVARDNHVSSELTRKELGRTGPAHGSRSATVLRREVSQARGRAAHVARQHPRHT